MTQPHIVIVGGGFAGLWATRALAKAPVQITLLDRANHHLFQPLLYQVATAGLSAPEIAAPLRHILRKQPNARVLLADVQGISVADRSVTLADGQLLHYDQLLVASGAAHAYFGNDAWAAFAPGLKTLDDALLIRRRLLMAFERAEAAADPADAQAWLQFAVVGGGPTGVELAGTLVEIARKTLGEEFRNIDPRQARVRLIESGPSPLGSFPPKLQARALAHLQQLGVDVACGAPVQGITEAGYQLAGTFVPCRTVLWAAGVAASPLGALLAPDAAGRDRAGRVKVTADLSLPGRPEVFVAGDLASVTQADGKPVPGIAPAAKQMGRHVAGAMLARLQGKTPTAFVYKDYGNLATIGRLAAVVDLRGLQFSGVLAWLFWLAAHVFFLIGFRNRISVLLNWAVSYFSYQRGARIVTGLRGSAPVAAAPLDSAGVAEAALVPVVSATAPPAAQSIAPAPQR